MVPSTDTATGVEESSSPADFGIPSALSVSTLANSHIGWFLLGGGRTELEQRLGYKPDIKTALKRSVFKHATAFYLSSILILACLSLLSVGLAIDLPGSFQISSLSFEVLPGIVAQILASIPFHWITLTLLAIALVIPALTVATSLINWLITLTLQPHHLPKMDFEEGIPDVFQTMIVVPAMFGSRKEIDSLSHQLEMHYLRNPEPGLTYALLTDFPDADSEFLPEDEELIQYARSKIEQLNAKYGSTENVIASSETIDIRDEAVALMDESNLFFLLHRKRLWNPSESKWMGWERKRGKLQELNHLLRGSSNLSFIDLETDPGRRTRAANILHRTRFVITLDADTILPRGAACRLAGTLAHPLNQAVFDEKTGRIISGYSILQPRMEIHPKSVNFSWFTRFFAGDAGLDLYTLAVSDAYQDLFGEGIYVGKGIYDVDAFERSTGKKIPENTVLSHDLLEGLMGRAGLVSDITMIEDYPQNYFIQAIRQRRWIRGDWQLLPWLLRLNKPPQVYSIIDRWKIIDNMRRSLLSPTLLLIFLLGLLFLPGNALLWTMVVLSTLAIPLITGLARSAIQILGGEYPGVALRPVGWNIVRWLLGIAFLPYEAYFSLDAILTTLYRMLISRRNLLQWTTAAQTAHVFGLQGRRNVAWQKLFASTVLALILIAVIQLLSNQPAVAVTPALIEVSPVLLLWIISPFIVWWINRPITKRTIPLKPEQINLLRQVTRRTWGFFERFVGPEDHWLPPDHYQENPVGTVAHRTSPTNIGLLLTSTLAAYDLGYLDQLGLATRLTTTMEALDQLERFRGHFMNWYDTLTLQPLHPRYISTVDSGNLAASLIITAQACMTMPEEPVFRWDLWQGYLDTLANLTETLTGMRKPEFDQQVEEINRKITSIQFDIFNSAKPF